MGAAIIGLGHLGSGLTPNGAGSDAFDLICRPDPGMAHSGLEAMGSSDLIGAWLTRSAQRAVSFSVRRPGPLRSKSHKLADEY